MSPRRAGEVGLLVVSAFAVGAGVVVHEAREKREASASTLSTAIGPGLSELPSGAPAASSPQVVDDGDQGCDIQDRGNGEYTEHGPLSMGRLFVRAGAVDPTGDYKLLLHLHGGNAVRKLVLPENLGLVVLVIDRGVGSSAYQGSFPSRRIWDDLLGSADRLVGEVIGHSAHANHVFVSSWSAGYSGVDEVLTVAAKDPSLSGIVLMDSLHASYEGNHQKLAPNQLPRFVEAAKRAETDPAFFFHVTHSEIKPPGYASTTETASFLLSQLGVEATSVSGGRDVVPMNRMAENGHFIVRGYVGNDAPAHCNQLRLLPSILEAHGIH